MTAQGASGGGKLTARLAPLFSKTGSLVTALTLIAGLISDVLTPVGPVAMWLGVFAVFILMVSMMLCLTPIDGKLKKLSPTYWFIPVGLLTLLSVVILFASYAISAGKRDEGGVLASVMPFLRQAQADLGVIRDNTTAIAGSVDSIDRKMDQVKRETSANPRKELSNQGIDWTPDNFLRYVELGDVQTVQLFLDGGMPIETSQNEGRPVAIMLARNKANPEAVLRLLVDAGFDPDHVFDSSMSFGPGSYTTLMWAIENDNPKLARGLAAVGADLDAPMDSAGSMFTVNRGAPLTLAVEREHFEVAQALIEGGADISSDDFGGYRLAYYLKRRAELAGKSISPAHQKALSLAEPRDGAKAREIRDFIEGSVSGDQKAKRAADIRKKLELLNLQILAASMAPDDAEQAKVIAYGREVDQLEAELRRLEAP